MDARIIGCELFEAYLSYRTSCAAVETCSANIDFASKCFEDSNTQENYPYTAVLIDTFLKEAKELDKWERRLQESGLALVHSVIRHARAQRLPHELVDIIVKHITPPPKQYSIPF